MEAHSYFLCTCVPASLPFNPKALPRAHFAELSQSQNTIMQLITIYFQLPSISEQTNHEGTILDILPLLVGSALNKYKQLHVLLCHREHL